jgi:hypothetical protein
LSDPVDRAQEMVFVAAVTAGAAIRRDVAGQEALEPPSSMTMRAAGPRVGIENIPERKIDPKARPKAESNCATVQESAPSAKTRLHRPRPH